MVFTYEQLTKAGDSIEPFKMGFDLAISFSQLVPSANGSNILLLASLDPTLATVQARLVYEHYHID